MTSKTPEGQLYNAMIKGDVLAKECPSRIVLRDITNRWGVLVIIALSEETLRFSELRRRVTGISEKMLSQTLQSLEYHQLVVRISHPVVPPHVEYNLTEHGQVVCEKLTDLTDWIENNLEILMPNEDFEAAVVNG